MYINILGSFNRYLLGLWTNIQKPEINYTVITNDVRSALSLRGMQSCGESEKLEEKYKLKINKQIYSNIL